jgi:uncharacterized protein (TIGR02466 family)
MSIEVPAVKLVRELYFPTFIHYQDLADATELNAAIRPAIYAWRTADPDGIVRSNVYTVGSWHSRLDMQRREEYRPLCDRILAAVQVIFDDLGYDAAYGPSIDNMWANINPRHGFNRSHVHPNVLWSGVYYVQAPPGCGRIFFSDPRVQAQMCTPRYAPDQPRKNEVWSEVYFEPIEGRLILFPAWLSHEVEPNLCELEDAAGDRISVSFNLAQRLRDPGGTAETAA